MRYSEIKELFKNDDIVMISAKENKGIEELLDKITNDYITNKVDSKSEIVITNIRHKDAIDKTIYSLKNVINAAKSGVPLDMISIDIQNSISYLGEILGDNVSEDIINGIFSKFCLGK